ncbi:hypothetical protein ACHAWX_000514 [Stephanocyclus meneghinianus]
MDDGHGHQPLTVCGLPLCRSKTNGRKCHPYAAVGRASGRSRADLQKGRMICQSEGAGGLCQRLVEKCCQFGGGKCGSQDKVVYGLAGGGQEYIGDIIGLIPEEESDICSLEEPEHLNWHLECDSSALGCAALTATDSSNYRGL